MIDVLLTAEGTYPFHRGGVGTWCDTLVSRMQGVRYHVMSVVATPFVPVRFRIPPHVQTFQAIPLWGTEEPSEHLDLPFAAIYERRLQTTPELVRTEFLPLVDRLLDQIYRPEQDGSAVASIALEMHRFFMRYDYLAAFKSELVWNRFKERTLALATQGVIPDPTVQDLLQGMGWVYRFFTVLNTPVPRVQVSHSSAAAFCALPAIVARLEHGTPMLLTEHGVYLREQYLSVGQSKLSHFGKRFLLGLVGSVARAALCTADQVSPVAAYNRRWETRLGVPAHKFHVIYNGVDPTVFQPKARPEVAPLTVVSVARIDPIKDLETLMRAADEVRRRMPEVKFMVYGGVSVPAYYERLLKLRADLRLEEGFIFAGHVDNPSAAYQSGDVVALSSISEGFPYAVVEAMMSGRPVVATDVGGTAEALGGLGLLVQPQDPSGMASALLQLLSNPAMRSQIAADARERALSLFTVDHQIELYRKSYENLARLAEEPGSVAVRVQLHLERADALLFAGDTEGALAELTAGLEANPQGPQGPVILLRMAEVYLKRGQTDLAMLCSERSEALAYLIDTSAA